MTEHPVRFGFIPWFRVGLASRIQAAGLAEGELRASAKIDVQATSTLGSQSHIASKQIELRGPSDIIGIDNRVIIRTDPKRDALDFESNLLPLVEFPPDFPWRYTPIGPVEADFSPGTKPRLKPWVALVVLKGGEFSVSWQGRPLPYLIIQPSPSLSVIDVLPNLEESWGWAHVQVVDTLEGESPDFSNADGVAQFVALHPELAISRILCMRRLEPRTHYHAFLVPTFEAGRRAGLNLPLAEIRGDEPAWSFDIEELGKRIILPLYYSFEFETAEEGDFEFYARLLGPQPVDETVGFQPFDAKEPGLGIAGVGPSKEIDLSNWRITLEEDRSGQSSARGILLREGALQSVLGKPSEWPNPELGQDPFQRDLRPVLNSSFISEGDDDPFFAPPLYGRWHAATLRIDETAYGWISDLNLDPRYRIAASLGFDVVQTKQEEYVAEAWKQVGDLDLANSKVRAGQVGIAISQRLVARHIKPLSEERMIAVAKPVLAHVLGSSTTLAQQLEQTIPYTLRSSSYRKLTRPNGHLARRIPAAVTPGLFRQPTILTRVNSRKIRVPDQVLPRQVAQLQAPARSNRPTWVPKSLRSALRRPLRAAVPILSTGLLVAWVLGIGIAVIATVASATLALLGLLERSERRHRRVDRVVEGFQAKVLESTSPPPHFQLGGIVQGWEGAPVSSPNRLAPEARQSQTLQFQKAAVQALRTAFPASEPQPLPKSADLYSIRKSLLSGIDPWATIPAYVLSGLQIHTDYVPSAENFDAIMDHPVFADPMYEPLRDLSPDYLLPGAGEVPQNATTLLLPNLRFIQAYLVGVNHAMAQELLWRHYPTDQRGSYFRQFWDISTQGPLPPVRSSEREDYWDIRPVHRWRRSSKLGDESFSSGSVSGSSLVLLVRGQLLNKYPNTLIYAVEATTYGLQGKTYWKRKNGETRLPLFRGTLPTDITFLGFDLTLDQVLTGAGWFFVFEEPFAEARFGMDVAPSARLDTPPTYWNDLSWGHLEGFNFVPVSGQSPLSGRVLRKSDKAQDDLRWGQDSATMAAILLQLPVRMLIHHSEMLRRDEAD